MTNRVLLDTECEDCGRVYRDEYIEHKTTEDDPPQEKRVIEEEGDEVQYPHYHEMRGFHACPECTKKLEARRE